MTIVLAAWNESETIVRTLEHIAELSYEGRVEVVVAANNSTDDTAMLRTQRVLAFVSRTDGCLRGETGHAQRPERCPRDRDDSRSS